MSREQESTIVLALAAVAMMAAVVLIFALGAPMFVGPIIGGETVLVAAITFATSVLLWLSITPEAKEEDYR